MKSEDDTTKRAARFHYEREEERFMIDVSHALQTPLTILKSELQRLQKKLSPSIDVKVLEKTIDDVSRLIYSLLSLARLGAAGGKRKRIIDTSELLRELVEYFRILAKEQDIRLVSRIAPGLLVKGTREQLERLVLNLVSNAVKYKRPKGRRAIIISFAARRKNVVLQVRDNGIGISKKDLPCIFGRFYRAETHAGAVSGAGLGLSIVKRIVENHGGTIRAESQPGKWTVFSVTLPQYFKKRPPRNAGRAIR